MGVPKFWQKYTWGNRKNNCYQSFKGESSNKHFTNINDEMRHLKISEIVMLQEKEIEPIIQ